jgi:hypothetical protein
MAEKRPPAVERLRQWRLRCARARTLREQWWTRWQVDALARAFHGDLHAEGDDRVTVNRFWPTIKAMLPGLFFALPSFRVRPTLKSSGQIPRQQSQLMEELLHAIAMQDMHLKAAGELALRQAFFSLGVLKVVYDPQLERNPDAGAPLWVRDADGLITYDPQTFLPIEARDPDTGKPSREPTHIVKDEVYRWQWVNAKNMLLPDQGPDQLRWTWIGEEITVSLAEAKEDDRFPADLRKQLRANRPQTAPGTPRPTPDLQFPHSAENQLDQMVTYIECWDLRDKKLRIYADGQTFSASAFLLEEDVPEGVEDHPYALLVFDPLIDPEPSPWPIPLTYNWLDLQREYAIRRRQMIEGAKRSARKGYYADDTFPDADAALQALQSNDDMAFAKVNDLNRIPVVVADPGLPPALLQDLTVLTDDWRVATGQPGARLAAARQRGGTATEALLTNQAANLRDLEARGKVTEWLATAGRKMLQQLRATMTIARAVKIRGLSEQDLQMFIARIYGAQGLTMAQMLPNLRESFLRQFGQERWMQVSREDLQFEADVTVNPISAKAKTVDAERQQFLQFVQLLSEAPQLMLSRELLRIVSDYFEMVSDELVDELFALGQRMQQAQQQAAQAKTGGGASMARQPLQSNAGTPSPTGLQATLMQMTGGT